MEFQTWVGFLVTSIILLLLPGPTVLTVISYSLSHGRSAKFALVAAVTLGDVTSAFFSLAGLGALLSASSVLFTIVKWSGGLYLIYLGCKTLYSGAVQVREDIKFDEQRKVFTSTYLVTALNPKSIIFYMAYLPLFVNPNSSAIYQMTLLACTFIVLACISTYCYSVFASSVREIFVSAKAQKTINRLSGGMLCATGLLALQMARPSQS
jgi:threonine/homoserine/homoserine lactone efflux protein